MSAAPTLHAVCCKRQQQCTPLQVQKIVGYKAPKEFVEKVELMAHEHHSLIKVDCTRAYHFGARYNVELEVIMPGELTLRESHDIGLELQHKIESLEEVERAFVHIDYEERSEPEHKVERLLLQQAQLVKRHHKGGGSIMHGDQSAAMDLRN